MSEDRCICCGEIVPEGRMVCPNCEAKLKDAPLTLKPMKNLSHGEMVQIAEGKKNKTPRYIDANKLIDLATHEGAYGYVDVHDIHNAPTADVVAVVRCKDCSFAEEIDFGLWVCHNADIQIVGDYVDEDWFCANGTTDLGEWDWNEDPRCADFVCSVCLERNITCEERCPHCGIKMRREEEKR